MRSPRLMAWAMVIFIAGSLAPGKRLLMARATSPLPKRTSSAA